MQEAFDEAALAILTGDHGAFIEALKTPALAKHRVSNGHATLLQMVACEEEHVPEPEEAVRMLIDAGAETTGPLISAAGCNAARVLHAMLEAGVPVDADHDSWTPLDEALYWNNADIAIMLVGQGASVERLSRAAGLGDFSAIGGFFSGSTLRSNAGPIGSPFVETVSESDRIDHRHILNHAFVMAVNCGQRSTADELLERGAEINARPPGYHWKGAAVHAACWRGDAELVQWLLDHGADPTLKDGLANADALGWARHHKHPKLVGLLS